MSSMSSIVPDDANLPVFHIEDDGGTDLMSQTMQNLIDNMGQQNHNFNDIHLSDISLGELMDGDDLDVSLETGPVSPASQTIANTPKPSNYIAYKQEPVQQVGAPPPVETEGVGDLTLATLDSDTMITTTTTTMTSSIVSTAQSVKADAVLLTPTYSQATVQKTVPTSPAESEVRKLLTQKHPRAQQSLLVPITAATVPTPATATSSSAAGTRGRSLLKTQRSKEEKKSSTKEDSGKSSTRRSSSKRSIRSRDVPLSSNAKNNTTSASQYKLATTPKGTPKASPACTPVVTPKVSPSVTPIGTPTTARKGTVIKLIPNTVSGRVSVKPSGSTAVNGPALLTALQSVAGPTSTGATRPTTIGLPIVTSTPQVVEELTLSHNSQSVLKVHHQRGLDIKIPIQSPSDSCASSPAMSTTGSTIFPPGSEVGSSNESRSTSPEPSIVKKKIKYGDYKKRLGPTESAASSRSSSPVVPIPRTNRRNAQPLPDPLTVIKEDHNYGHRKSYLPPLTLESNPILPVPASCGASQSSMSPSSSVGSNSPKSSLVNSSAQNPSPFLTQMLQNPTLQKEVAEETRKCRQKSMKNMRTVAERQRDGDYSQSNTELVDMDLDSDYEEEQEPQERIELNNHLQLIGHHKASSRSNHQRHQQLKVQELERQHKASEAAKRKQAEQQAEKKDSHNKKCGSKLQKLPDGREVIANAREEKRCESVAVKAKAPKRVSPSSPVQWASQDSADKLRKTGKSTERQQAEPKPIPLEAQEPLADPRPRPQTGKKTFDLKVPRMKEQLAVKSNLAKPRLVYDEDEDIMPHHEVVKFEPVPAHRAEFALTVNHRDPLGLNSIPQSYSGQPAMKGTSPPSAVKPESKYFNVVEFDPLDLEKEPVPEKPLQQELIHNPPQSTGISVSIPKLVVKTEPDVEKNSSDISPPVNPTPTAASDDVTNQPNCDSCSRKQNEKLSETLSNKDTTGEQVSEPKTASANLKKSKCFEGRTPQKSDNKRPNKRKSTKVTTSKDEPAAKVVRRYRQRPKPESEDEGLVMDKLPSYMTVMASKSPERAPPRHRANDLASNVPAFDRDPSPDRSDPVMNKVPAYQSCFTNSTKYDSIEQQTHVPEDGQILDEDRDDDAVWDTAVMGEQDKTIPVAKNAARPSMSACTSRSQSPNLVIASAQPSRAPSCAASQASSHRSRSRSCARSKSRDRSRSGSRYRRTRKHRRSYSTDSNSSSESDTRRSRSPVRRHRRSSSRQRRSSSRRSGGGASHYRSSYSRSPAHSRRHRSGSYRRRSSSRKRHSRSRSRSQSPYSRRMDHRRRRERVPRRSRSPHQPEKDDDRRILYVGRIPDHFKERHLEELFSQFGRIIKTSVHPQTHTNKDNFGFVTFEKADSAYAAIDSGKKVDGCKNFDLCFGNRRRFCKEEYHDLDGDMAIVEQGYGYGYNGGAGGGEDNSFEALLKSMTKRR